MTYNKMIEHSDPYPESNKRFQQAKHYVFTNDSWWDSNGWCDCCDDQYMEAYNCEELLALGSGTQSNEFDIKVELLVATGSFDYDFLCSYKEEDLEFMLEDLGITYEIIKED